MFPVSNSRKSVQPGTAAYTAYFSIIETYCQAASALSESRSVAQTSSPPRQLCSPIQPYAVAFVFPEPLAPNIIPAAGIATTLKDRRPVSVAVGDSVTAPTDSEISIMCEASGVPHPDIQWTKDGRQINSGARFVVSSNGTLLIRGVQLGDNGRYACTVRSRAGQDSQASNIIVKGER